MVYLTLHFNIIIMKLFIIWVASMALIMLALCSCGSMPQERKIMNSEQWSNSIYNKSNADFVDEVAFNEGIAPSLVTQEMFDHRYSSGY